MPATAARATAAVPQPDAFGLPGRRQDRLLQGRGRMSARQVLRLLQVAGKTGSGNGWRYGFRQRLKKSSVSR